MSEGLLIPIPSPLLGTVAQTLTSLQTLSTTSAWTAFPGFATVTITGGIGDFVVVTSKGTAATVTGSLTTDYFQVLIGQPDGSFVAPFVSTGSTPNVFGTFVLTQAGPHTFQLRYYFTGATPVVTFNPAMVVAGFPISYAIFTTDHRSPLG